MSQQINLFNPRFTRQKNYLSARTLAAIFGVALLLSVLAAIHAKQGVTVLEQQALQVKADLAAREARKASADTEFAPRQRSVTLEQQLAQADSDNSALRQVSDILDQGEFGNTRGYSAYFRALGRSRVDGLWLTGVSIAGAGQGIALHGRTLQPALLPSYLDGLAREPVLKGISFGRLEMGAPKPAGDQPPSPSTAAAAAPARFVEFSLASDAAPKEGARP